MNTNKLLLVFIGIVSLSVGSKDSNSVLNTLNNQTTGINDADSLFNMKNQIIYPTISENETQANISNLLSNLTRSERSETRDGFSNSTSHEIQRFKRAADPLSDYSGKLSTVARISNGISLLAGLVNKNIPIDTVISELLHFGDVKLSEVVALQKDKVEAAISQLETTKTGLDDSSTVRTLEENTIGMGRVREAYIESDFENFQHPTDYFTEAKSFKDDKTDLSGFQTAENAVVDALTKFDELAKIQDNVKDNKGLVEDKITKIGNKLEELLTVSQQMSQIVNSVDSYSKLADGETILKPVQQILDLLEVHRTLPNVPAGLVADAGKNMDALNSFSSSFASAQSAITVLRDLVSSQLVPSPGNRQYTAGFPNGAADLKKLVKDIRDPSFESTIGGGKNFARLSGGLKPLEEFTKKLEASESALKPIATSEILQSARNAAELQKLTSGLTVASADAVSVAQMLLDNQFNTISGAFVTPVVNLMGNARKLSKELAQVKSSASAFPQPPQEMTDVKEILKKLPDVHGLKEVQEAVDELKGVPDKVKAVTEYLTKLQEFLKNVPDATDTRTTADLVFQADGDLKTLKAIIDNDMVPKLNAIKDSKESIDSVVRALQASKIIRDFKTDDGKNINVALDAIAKAASSIKDLQKPPANRKKRQTDEVKDLVKWKNAQRMSAALGLSAITISSMAQLKGMETTVVQDLKSKAPIFDTEVAKVTDSSKKADILKKWGDHMAFTSSLDSTINQIKDFGAKLSVDKDLRKLGAHLKDAKAVGDVNQNIADKSEAVSMLISETPTPNADLQALKTQLDTLAALDLQFSSHHSAFPDVQGALKSFFDFVTGFVTPKKQPSGSSGAGGAGGAAGGAPQEPLPAWYYPTIIIGSIVGLILLYVLFKFIYELPWGFQKVQDDWFPKALKQDWASGAAMAMGVMNDLEDEDRGGWSPWGKVPNRKMRHPTGVNFSTRVWGWVLAPLGLRPRIDANFVSLPGSNVYIATQGPLAAGGGKVDTRADFWEMVHRHKTDTIVQLCNFLELDSFDVYCADMVRIPSDKCAVYYPQTVGETAEFGAYSIKNVGFEMILDHYVKLVTLMLSKNGGAERKVELYFHVKWPDHSIPDNLKTVVELVHTIKKSKHPIVVHCSAGRGRTMTLIAIDCLARSGERHPNRTVDSAVMKIRNQRAGGLQESGQCYFAVTGSTMLLAMENDKMDEIFTASQMNAINATLKKLLAEAYDKEMGKLVYQAWQRRLIFAEQSGRTTSPEVLNYDFEQIGEQVEVSEIIRLNEEARDEKEMAARMAQRATNAENRQKEKENSELRKANEAKEAEKRIKEKTEHLWSPMNKTDQLYLDIMEVKKAEEIKAKKLAEKMAKMAKMKKKKGENEKKKKMSGSGSASGSKTAKTAKTTSQEKTGGKSGETASKSREPGGKECVAIDMDV